MVVLPPTRRQCGDNGVSIAAVSALLCEKGGHKVTTHWVMANRTDSRNKSLTFDNPLDFAHCESINLETRQRYGVVVCVCGCGGARPADLRSESVSHVGERGDGSNSDSDVLATTVALLMELKAFRCSG